MTKYQYDPETFLIKSIHSSIRDKDIQNISYKINTVGEIEEVIDHHQANLEDNLHTNLSASYEYDTLGQLISYEREGAQLKNNEKHEFSYDELGNFSSNSLFSSEKYIVKPGTPYIHWGTKDKPYEYDDRGLLIKNPNINNIEWDLENRVVLLETKNGDIYHYAYDDNNQRYLKKKSDLEEKYPFKEYHVKLKEKVDNKPYHGVSFVYLGNEKLVKIDHLSHKFDEQKDSVFYYLRDHLTGTNYLVTKDGKSIEQVAYYPYGLELKNSREWNRHKKNVVKELPLKEHKLSYRYTGHYFDDESSLYYANNRFYDPSLGRFISPDLFFLNNVDKCEDSPLECNLYSYAKNNPISYVDPSGKCAVETALGIAVNCSIVGSIGAGWTYYQTGGDLRETGKSFVSGFVGAFIGGAVGIGVFGKMVSNWDNIGTAIFAIPPSTGAAILSGIFAGKATNHILHKDFKKTETPDSFKALPGGVPLDNLDNKSVTRPGAVSLPKEGGTVEKNKSDTYTSDVRLDSMFSSSLPNNGKFEISVQNSL